MPVKTTLTRKTKPAQESSGGGERADVGAVATKKKCYFCENKKEPSYTDVASLRKSFSERARIVPRQRSGACAKHQRKLSQQIKYSRFLGMLPFVNKV